MWHYKHRDSDQAENYKLDKNRIETRQSSTYTILKKKKKRSKKRREMERE